MLRPQGPTPQKVCKETYRNMFATHTNQWESDIDHEPHRDFCQFIAAADRRVDPCLPTTSKKVRTIITNIRIARIRPSERSRRRTMRCRNRSAVTCVPGLVPLYPSGAVGANLVPEHLDCGLAIDPELACLCYPVAFGIRTAWT